ncbi:VOC family protein [Mycolicibacterium sp. lyk4-40-TYG-92]|uniref:VOC family protein n=1 Tax=Mycolicibacterium sp. lyk4-40-TYG-92 TaxID=3040295 RepID=UPI00254A42D0|nr:VOC family protein [Mycolicibacterium sp. lyk4-40-TYG-92]
MRFESVGITVDCGADAVDALAEFWSATMGYTKILPWVLVDPTGVHPRILFHAVPEPKTVKNRWHLDLYVDHLDNLNAEIARLTSLGATQVRYYDDISHGFTNTFAVMTDPAGNEFCVCAPHIPVGSTSNG